MALAIGGSFAGTVAASDTTGTSTAPTVVGENNSTMPDWEEPTCDRCHETLDTNPVPRTLENDVEYQPDHAFELQHGEEMWCLDCHGKADRTTLRLANGSVVEWTPENEMRQCAACHGPVFEDWKNQIHGKWTGSWDEPTSEKTCTDCHDPHDPEFHAIEPEPAPREPPAGPTVAQSVLPAGYYVAVGFVGILVTGLLGYAGLALRRDR